MASSIQTWGLSCEGQLLSLVHILKRTPLWPPHVSSSCPLTCRSIFGVLGRNSKHSFSAWGGRPPHRPLHTCPGAIHVTRVCAFPSVHPLACIYFVPLSTIPPFKHKQSLSSLYVLFFLRFNSAPKNVTWNTAVLSWLTAFSCGYMQLNANWII